MTDSIVPYKDLLSPPINRAAYSDRTAWLMAVMSKLAYTRFEGATPVEAAVADAMKLITGKENPEEQGKKISKDFNGGRLLSILKSVANSENRDKNMKHLEDNLSELKFTLIKTFSVSIPFIADTQAFVAKLEEEGRPPFLVLAFRGTEPKKVADLKADLQANTKILGRLGGPGGSVFIPSEKTNLNFDEKMLPKVKVHSGFWSAFKVIEDGLNKTLNSEELKNLPLYITGHSLGGALAVVSTYALKSDRIACCYTYGSPRVGNLEFGQCIKAPVYRIINASDAVPRVPPGVLIDGITVVLRALPVIPYFDKFADLLERFRDYRHYGDLRYMNAADSSLSEDGKPCFPGLVVMANPPQISRTIWLFKRWAKTLGKAAGGDHSIDLYEEKLAYWAHVRSIK